MYGPPAQKSVSLEEHDEESRLAQRRADKWMIVGAGLMGCGRPGSSGSRSSCVASGCSARPRGRAVDAADDRHADRLPGDDRRDAQQPWLGLDWLANHTLINRVLTAGWGYLFDAGYFWHYNELWLGGAGGPG